MQYIAETREFQIKEKTVVNSTVSTGDTRS